MDGANGHAVAAPTCPACGKAHLVGSEGVMVRDAGGKEHVFHEVCFLRQRLAEEEHKSAAMAQLFGGVLWKLGRSVRVHIGDVRAAKALGSPVRTKGAPGGFIDVWIGEEPRVVLATGMPTPRG